MTGVQTCALPISFVDNHDVTRVASILSNENHLPLIYALAFGAMDGTSGIVLDNFSLRGSSGLSLRSVPVWMMREFNEQRPYDLIILQYGLNVATERGRNYDKYIAGMQTTVQHLKEAFPQAAILIVSVGDRDYKTEEGELRTMPGIKNLVRYQQNLAADEAVAF